MKISGLPTWRDLVRLAADITAVRNVTPLFGTSQVKGNVADTAEVVMETALKDFKKQLEEFVEEATRMKVVWVRPPAAQDPSRNTTLDMNKPPPHLAGKRVRVRK